MKISEPMQSHRTGSTPAVVASLWKVDDEVTRLMMHSFYVRLKRCMGAARALRVAQSEVRRNHPNPYYWAAFILSGDPRQ
jgi:CHAT domain-containing protein